MAGISNEYHLRVEVAGEQDGDSPGSSSRNVWFWHENPAAIEALIRSRLLP